MAGDILDGAVIAEGARAIINTGQLIFVFLLITALVIGIVFTILLVVRFKHTVIIRDVAHGRVIITAKKAREYTDKKGVIWWSLRGVKNKEDRLMDVPHSKCIDTDAKGRKWVEVYKLSTGGYVPIYDKANIALIPDDVTTIANSTMIKEREEIFNKNPEGLERDQKIDRWKQKVIDTWCKEHDYDKAFHPFSTQDRQAIVNNIKDAQERKHKGIMEQLPAMVTVGMLALVVVCGMIFIPDWFEAKAQLHQENSVIATTLKETSIVLRDIQQGQQTIENQLNNLDNKVVKKDTNQPISPPN